MKSRPNYRLYLPAFCAGIFTIIAQIVFMREMFVVVQGNELLFGIFFFTWFAGVITGALASSRISDRIANPARWAVLLVTVQTILAPALVFLIRSFRIIFTVPAGEFIPLLQFVLGCMATTFLFSLLTGAFFPFICRVAATKAFREGAIGRIYTVDAAGGIIGSVIFTFILVQILPPLKILFVTAFLVQVSVLALTMSEPDFGKKIRYAGMALAAAFLILALTPPGNFLEKTAFNLRWKSGTPGFEHVDSLNTPYQQLSLAERAGQFTLLSNGSVVSSFPDPYSTAQETHFIMGMCPESRRVLILGGGNPQVLPEILKYRVEQIDYVEMDMNLLDFIKPYLSEEVRKALQDPRVHIHQEDPRLFVRELSRGERPGRYDIVWSAAPDPITAESNRFYTVDFFTDCMEIMTRNGIFICSSGSAVNYIGEEVSDFIRSIYKSLTAVFEDVQASPGQTIYYFSSTRRNAITMDPRSLAIRYRRRNIQSRYFSAEFFRSILQREQVRFTQNALGKNLDDVSLNTDLHPVTYLFSLRMWGGQAERGIVPWFELFSRLKAAHITAAIILLLVLLVLYTKVILKKEKQRTTFSLEYLVFCSGWCGMAAELVFLYYFQNIYGCVYQRIGLFIASFMTGLAAGGATGAFVAKIIHSPKRLRSVLISADALFWLFFLLAAFLIPSLEISESVFYLIVAISGTLTGFQFPMASATLLLAGGKVGKSAGYLDLADHAGAAMGSFVTAIILIPALGIPLTLFLMAFLKLTSITLIKSNG